MHANMQAGKEVYMFACKQVDTYAEALAIIIELCHVVTEKGSTPEYPGVECTKRKTASRLRRTRDRLTLHQRHCLGLPGLLSRLSREFGYEKAPPRLSEG